MTQRIDTVVIGGSAGSFTALKQLLGDLPADLPAAVMVCLHHAAGSGVRAADLLVPHCPLPIVVAEDGMPMKPGRLHFAPPDTHLLIGSDHLHLRRGAHENNFRPAVDPLFRSAAVYRPGRAIGVVLSGLMDDGAAGVRAMMRTACRTLVQDPDGAEFPDMPRAALAANPEAEAIPLDGLAGRIAALVGTPAESGVGVPWDIGVELKIAALEDASMETERKLGTLSPYNCPHCNGVLWEVEDGPIHRYRCHTGHAYTAATLDAAQEEALDRSLFDSLRAHRGRADLMRRMIARDDGVGERMRVRIALVEEDADRLESIIRERRAR